MPSARKRVKLTPAVPEPYFESEDEWEAERRGVATVGPDDEESDDEEEGEEEEGVAQFEDDEEDYLTQPQSDEEDEQAVLSKEISSIPFTSLLKAQKKLNAKRQVSEDDDSDPSSEGESDQRAGPSRKRENALAEGSVRPLKQERRKNGSLRKADRASKHAPMEMSSKRAVGRKREVVEAVSKPQARDPRFDSLSGAFRPELFSKSYSFLADAHTRELDELRKTAKAARRNLAVDPSERAKIEAALVRMESRETERKRREREREALTEWKKEEEKKREAGKGDFYLKKADKKKVLLKAKYEALAGDKRQLRKSIEKKRKKVAQKDKKLIPRERVASSGF